MMTSSFTSLVTDGHLTEAQQVFVNANWDSVILRVAQAVTDRRVMEATCTWSTDKQARVLIDFEVFFGFQQTPYLHIRGGTKVLLSLE